MRWDFGCGGFLNKTGGNMKKIIFSIMFIFLFGVVAVPQSVCKKDGQAQSNFIMQCHNIMTLNVSIQGAARGGDYTPPAGTSGFLFCKCIAYKFNIKKYAKNEDCEFTDVFIEQASNDSTILSECGMYKPY